MFAQATNVQFAVLAAVVIATCLPSACWGQLSFHTDANTNSFTLKTPSLQQTFTRYYGGKQSAAEETSAPLTIDEVAATATATEAEAVEDEQQNSAQYTGYAPTGLQYPALYQHPGQRQQYQIQLHQHQLAGLAGLPPVHYPQANLQLPKQSTRSGNGLQRIPGGASHSSHSAKTTKLSLQQQVQQLQAQQLRQQQQLLLQQQAIQQQQQQQQGLLPAQASAIGSIASGQAAIPAAAPKAGATGPLNLPSYADQMQAAYLDYQRQRMEFERQQQQLLHKLYHNFPDVSVASGPSSGNGPGSGALAASSDGSQPQAHRASGGLRYGGASVSNGLQSGQPQQQQRQSGQSGSGSGTATGSGSSAGGALALAGGAGAPFYSLEQHYGFLQQQQQNILRDQQHSVQQQYVSNSAPITTQTYGMAVPESSVLGSAPYESAQAVSHVSFSNGNLSYNF